MSNINVIIIVLIEYMIHHSYLNTIAFNILIAYSITIAYYNINTPYCTTSPHTKARTFRAISEHACTHILLIF